SGAGKSTLAYAVERKLFDMGRAVYVLDGQNLRHDLNKGLPQDRALSQAQQWYCSEAHRLQGPAARDR
ncbi:bifunctional sulfate adenylyltransferase subunit 1/adenylylsulfate kinase protein, partial [Pseudomonas syringae pv. japonica str. M301072]